jgi:large subunit ribosomal protein L9
MDIILLKDVEKVGDQHEIVKVKDGFGRNYLIPQGFAVVANDSNRRKYASIVRALDKREASKLGAYREVAATLEGKTVKIIAKSGTSGKLFGSVDTAQLAKAISEQLGQSVERKRVISEPLKELGTHVVTVMLHKQVSASVNIEIVAENVEA